MLINTVLSPDILASQHFDDQLYQVNTEQLLKGIRSNGIVLVDKDNRLYDELCDNAEKLAESKGGKFATILFEELLKQERQRNKRFIQTNCEVGASHSSDEAATIVAMRCKADATVVSSKEGARVASHAKAVVISDYLRSDLESRRRAFAESRVDSCDMMSEREFADIIASATRFTKNLKFYDKILGKGTGTSFFYRGLERVIKMWICAAYFPKSELSVEIYTVVDTTRNALSPSDAFSIVNRDIRQSLASHFGIPVSLTFKFDPTNNCHPRHMQTDSCYIQFERGFDIVERNGTLKRSFLNLAPTADAHLLQYRQLRDFNPDKP